MDTSMIEPDCGGHARGTHDRLLILEVNIEFREEFQ